MDGILWCDQSIKSSFIVLSRGTISFAVNLFLTVDNWHSREWRGKVADNPHINLDAKLVPVHFRQYAYADNMREGATSEALSQSRQLTAT